MIVHFFVLYAFTANLLSEQRGSLDGKSNAINIRIEVGVPFREHDVH